jgi:hypothetical protein
MGAEWWSVSSRLDPDVALLSRTDVGTRCVLLDAKDRPHLTQGAVAVEASKYQWGIRRDDASVLGADAVILASPYGGDEPIDRGHAQHWAWHAHPNAPQQQAPGVVGTDISSAVIGALLVEHLELPLGALRA